MKFLDQLNCYQHLREVIQ